MHFAYHIDNFSFFFIIQWFFFINYMLSRSGVVGLRALLIRAKGRYSGFPSKILEYSFYGQWFSKCPPLNTHQKKK
jgi:hypothetical protein